MSLFKIRLFVGVAALSAASALAAQASAAINVNGGGSSLLAPYWAQAVGCWDNDTGNGSYVNKGTPGTIVTPTAAACPPPTPVTGTVIGFVASGSGAGQAATFAHDGTIALFGTNPNGSGSKVFTSGGVQYGLSDNALVDSDVGVYSVGTGASYTPPNSRPAITTPASYQGLTFGAGTGLSTDYPVAKPLYGPLVQFPVSIDPVAIAYNPNYAAGQALQLPAGQTLKLDATAYCKIFTGAITDWNDSYLASINGVTSLTVGGASAPIKLVGRSDSSGTTSIFTRHLAAACDSVLAPAANPYTAGATTLPTAVVSLFTTASGSGGVATALNANAGSIGYIGPDYVLPAVNNTGLNAYNLPAAQLKNANGAYIAPSGAAATLAFGSVAPPSTAAARADATLWVQGTAKTVPLANPTATGAYPIVGTTNFIGYACYASVNTVNSLRAFLNFGATTPAQNILANAGLAPLPSTWFQAISDVFVNPINGAANAGLNIYFAEAVSGSNGLGRTNSNCTASGVVGG